MTLTVISPPGEKALSLVEAKTWLRIGHDGEDQLVSDLVASAQARLEEAAGLALVTRTLRRTLRSWPNSLARTGVRLRPSPVKSLVSVTVIDAEDVSSDVTSHFELIDGKLCVKQTSWCPPVPFGAIVQIDFDAGFGDASDVPDDLVQALKAVLLESYRRSADAAMPPEAQAVIAARREVLL
ncbi:hypothetical protein WNY37_13095 [Henriciella sp. AS95]|uniref:head-tail connector protein n=1 Tax=Henriciella sp. AS95 TaxID=3135782 RepID=UPI00316C9241